MHESCSSFSPNKFPKERIILEEKFYIISFKRGYLYESRKKSTTRKQNVLRAKEHIKPKNIKKQDFK